MKRKSPQPRSPSYRIDETSWLGDDTPPTLWNPTAAVNWSLLFTPVFGAILHMKNWQALGETEKAEICKAWAILNFAIILGLSLITILQPAESAFHVHLLRNLFVLFLAWYAGNAREQTGYVKSRFGHAYQRRDWRIPSLMATLGLMGYVTTICLLGHYLSHTGIGLSPSRQRPAIRANSEVNAYLRGAPPALSTQAATNLANGAKGECPPGKLQTSRFSTINAWVSINSRRGST